MQFFSYFFHVQGQLSGRYVVDLKLTNEDAVNPRFAPPPPATIV
jgi:hypothetical protein